MIFGIKSSAFFDSIVRKVVMSLGVNGATPFYMKSNHQTAFNHSFRDESSYDPSKQTKVKCAFCGCWAKKGHPCYQCKRSPSGAMVNRAPPVGPYRPVSATPVNQQATPRPVSVQKPQSALTHKFRETSTYNPSAQTKVKCSFCGCWANHGKQCSLCRTFNK